MQIFNQNTSPPTLAIEVDSEYNIKVYDTDLKQDLQKVGICTTPFFELRKEDPFLKMEKNEPFLQKNGRAREMSQTRSLIYLPNENDSQEIKEYYVKIFTAYFKTHLSHHGYRLNLLASEER